MVLRLTLCACLIASALLATTITGPTVSPATISFTSPDPDQTPVNGSSTATIQWTMSGNTLGSWSLTVQSVSSSLGSCPAVPASAVSFQCNSATPDTLGNASCSSGSFSLSTSPQTIASGTRQGAGVSPTTVTISFTFTDAWKYPASSSCSVQIIYTVTAS